MLKTLLYSGIEPITLKEAKDWLNITSPDDDPLLYSMITAARKHIEEEHNVIITSRTIEWKFDRFPQSTILTLPVWPVQSIVITYLDGDGASQTHASSNYTTDFNRNPCRVEDISGWIGTYAHIESVTITMVCGFDKIVTATTATDVINLTAHGLSNGDRVRFKATNLLPAPLSHDWYYVVSSSTDTFKVAKNPAGSAITLTSTGTGTIFLDQTPEGVKNAVKTLVFDMYQNRDSEGKVPSMYNFYVQPYRNENHV